MIWFKFLTHEYMDMYPELLFKTFNSIEEAREFAKQMNANYTGGTTEFVGYAKKQEIIDFVNKENLDDVLGEETLTDINNNDNYYENITKIKTTL